MSFYSDLALTVSDLLVQFGQPVTVSKNGMGVEDPTTGVVTIPVVTSTETGVLLDYIYRTFGEAIETPSRILGVNKRLLLTTGTAVNPEDRVFVGGDWYLIVAVKSANPGGTNLIYDLWIQR